MTDKASDLWGDTDPAALARNTLADENVRKAIFGATSISAAEFLRGATPEISEATKALVGATQAYSPEALKSLAGITSASDEMRKQYKDLVAGISAQRHLLDDIKFDVVTPRELPAMAPIRIPPNPILQTNARLDSLRGDMNKLVEVERSQTALMQSLVDIGRGTLEQTTSYATEAQATTRVARISAWLAGAAIVVTLLTSAAAIVYSRLDAASSTSQLERFVALQSAANNEIRSLQSALATEGEARAQLQLRIDALVKAKATASQPPGRPSVSHSKQGGAREVR